MESESESSPPFGANEPSQFGWASSVAFAEDFYSLLAEYVPGDTTLNELRVLTAIALAEVAGEGTSVTQIAADTGVSRASVSRLTAQWTEMERLRETPHPGDGRRRILGFTEEAKRLSKEWGGGMAEIFKAHYGEGKG